MILMKDRLLSNVTYAHDDNVKNTLPTESDRKKPQKKSFLRYSNAKELTEDKWGLKNLA